MNDNPAIWNVCPKCGQQLYSGFVAHVCLVQARPNTSPMIRPDREERMRLLEAIEKAAREFRRFVLEGNATPGAIGSAEWSDGYYDRARAVDTALAAYQEVSS